MEQVLRFTRHIKKTEERQYLEIPFEIPEGAERMDLCYHYKRYEKSEGEQGVAVREVNIIDLALLSPAGFMGASGSNRQHIAISAVNTSRGYLATPILPGTWNVIAGAYHVEAAGVDVEYEITLTMKSRRLLKGDLHLHSTASDGNLTPRQLMQEAVWCGLDFICISDHNAFSQNDEMAAPPEGLTVIPGMELTHYQGHCNFIGARRPVSNPFGINSVKELQERVKEAADNGALVSINHPISDCPWEWGMEAIEYDTVEIWNGASYPDQTIACLDWWHGELLKGQHLPIVGGSDFHSMEAMRTIGSPTTWVYALSAEKEDILKALRAGHSFLTMNHQGPVMEVFAGNGSLGDTVAGVWEVKAVFEYLEAGDRIVVITDQEKIEYLCEQRVNRRELILPVEAARFMRFEVYRSKIRQLAELPCLISNPVYFETMTLENEHDK